MDFHDLNCSEFHGEYDGTNLVVPDLILIEAQRPKHYTEFCIWVGNYSIIIYHNDLYIASHTLGEILHMLQDNYKINIYLQDKYPHNLGGRSICQLKEYLEMLYVNVNILFKDNLPTDLHIAFKIIKLLIKKGNLNLIHNKNTYVHFNDLSRKRKLDKLYNGV